MKELTSTSAVIDALGGNAEVAKICSTPDKRVTAKVVSSWRSGQFPAKTYLVLQKALSSGKNKGKYSAPVTLWSMISTQHEKRSA